MKTIAFFNNKGGVGKTSLAYHLAWMYTNLGVRVVAADLDPQANLTTMFVREEDLEAVWERGQERTIMTPIRPLLEGVGAIGSPATWPIDGITLIPGDLALSLFEDELSQQWPKCLSGEVRAFRVITAFAEVLARCGRETGAELALIDVGPSLGALNRAALVAADHVVVPLAPDLFSIKGLENLGPRLRLWRSEWQDRLDRKPPSLGEGLPRGRMEPLGYVVMQHAVRLDRPVKAYARWMDSIPTTYRTAVLDEAPQARLSIENDPHCLAALKHFRSLMPLAQEARKPMFALRPADGAIGGHAQAAQECYRDFEALARAIARRAGVAVA